MNIQIDKIYTGNNLDILKTFEYNIFDYIDQQQTEVRI